MNEKRALRYSYFSHQFTKDEVVALYHSLNVSTLFIPLWIAKILRIFKHGSTLGNILKNTPIDRQKDIRKLIQKLCEQKFLVDVHYNELKDLQKIQKRYLTRPEIGILYLLLTDNCNFRCAYCFIEGVLPKDYHFSLMSQKIAREAINLYSRTLSKNAGRKTIIFYGGEPLINKKVFRFCLEYIQKLKDQNELPEEVAITINTNGSLITPGIAELMKKYNVAVSVSIDGPQKIHNKYRITSDGRGSFDKVIAGYKILKEKGVNTGISCTVGDHNIDQLTQIVKWFISDLKIDFLGLNQFTDIPGKPLSSESYVRKFADATIQSFLIARENGLYEDRMMRKVETFVEKRVYPFDCAGCGRQLVIMPNGQVGVCHAYTGTKEYFTKTKINKVNPDKEPVWQEWCKRSPIGMPQCTDCPSLGICGGGCPYNAHVNFGTIWAKDHYFCIYAEKVLEWMIWDLYEQTKK